MLLFIILFLFILNFSFQYNCDHDNIQIQNYLQNLYEQSEKHAPKQTSRISEAKENPQPIRITIDYSRIEQTNDLTQSQIKIIKKLIGLSSDYFSQMLKITPLKGNNKYPKYLSGECNGIIIPENDKQIGIPNSDLHIYIFYMNDNKDDSRANANACAFQEITYRPIFGRIQINITNMVFQINDHKLFRQNLESFIHETLHILGFSKSQFQYWIDPSTGKTYKKGNNQIQKTVNVRGKETIMLFSQNILDVTRKHFKCQNAEGITLENESKSQSQIGSHWDKSLLSNELMTNSAFGLVRVFSIFTIALLKDTGYYQEVNQNLSSELQWGKGKGCEFLTQVCYSQYSFPEFSTENQKYICTFDRHGIGYSRISSTTDNCYVVDAYLTRICIDQSNQANENAVKTMQYYGFDSRCFTSTSTQPKYQTIYKDQRSRCHKFKCDENTITVFIPQIQTQITCTQEDKGKALDINKDDPKMGQITCPNDYNDFCNYSKPCRDNCSSNGICVRGFCICIKGFGGENCSQNCPFGVIFNSDCVSQCPEGLFQGPDNACRKQCPSTYYNSNGKCLICNSQCLECNGGDPNQCTACHFVDVLMENQCVLCNGDVCYKDIEYEILIKQQNLIIIQFQSIIYNLQKYMDNIVVLIEDFTYFEIERTIIDNKQIQLKFNFTRNPPLISTRVDIYFNKNNYLRIKDNKKFIYNIFTYEYEQNQIVNIQNYQKAIIALSIIAFIFTIVIFFYGQLQFIDGIIEKYQLVYMMKLISIKQNLYMYVFIYIYIQQSFQSRNIL
ncbi:leishmanolysin family protein, putative [Ichthyophthirius multifiliis]|uniref:Leishmanolysin family protein, putative n=1 Tax=Ichthyophthirius multifiliis TaxID=5932 RepID=G0R6B5_ICHMU|nr:leishmanolysin family protein, putative [Ichthyophthirius multifiliis]EGR26987.1 leishmanolysin family protein, putative [Ichthyophthirius multifiliis]|eukprot:XP_004023871.1 leishmanolysin family protein, putative [Ichthyophthirius multifiliis]